MPEVFPRAPNPIQTAEAAKKIAAFRQKLLDLSNRNRLLNFGHSPRSRGHLRVVDEIPDVVFGSLLNGTSFGCRPLPALDQDRESPEDEGTDTFRAALEEERHGNSEFQRRQQEIETAYARDQDEDRYESGRGRLERWLRNLVREQQGLLPLRSSAVESMVAWAKAHGIAPSFDLPRTPQGTRPGHFDSFLQTLLLPEDLDAKLGGIFELAEEAVREKGVATLYLAFGFLEWFEADSSDKPLFAPLVLVAVTIEKSVEDGKVSYVITSPGEEPQANITLAARLRQDFNLVLPDFDEDETLDGYLTKVESLIHRQSRWRVRRFITLGHFAFARLVMFNDLDESKWPKDRVPSSHLLIRELFGGSSQAGTGMREVYNPDEPTPGTPSPCLVVDADSSQYSAVVDVLRGDSLVVHGPPGTGKSQTITNIIAAALERGKSVLFVAEKLAALEVVMSRLCGVGLGDFCLELHSTKATKASVIEALRQRLAVTGASALAPVTAKNGRGAVDEYGDLQELETAKKDLRRYLDLLREKLGFSGYTLQQVLWRAHRRGPRELPVVLREVQLDDIDSWNDTKLQRVLGFCRHLAESEKALRQSPKACPWSFVRAEGLSAADLPTVERIAQTFADGCVSLGQTLAELRLATNTQGALSLDEVTALVTELLRLPAFAGVDEHQTFDRLALVRGEETMIRLTRAEATCRELDSRLQDYLHEGTTVNRMRAAGIKQAIEVLQPLVDETGSLEDLQLRAHELLDDAESLSAVEPVVLQVYRLVHHSADSGNNLPAVCMVLDWLHAWTATPPQIWPDRSPARLAENASALLEQIVARFHRLQQKARRLQKRLEFDPDVVSADECASHRGVLSAHGVFGVFNRNYRRVRRAARGFYPDRRKPPKAEIRADLVALEEFARERDALFDEPSTIALLGPYAAATKTDFSHVQAVVDWAQVVRRIVPHDHALGRLLQTFLFQAPAVELAESLARIPRSHLTKLRNLAARSPEHLIDASARAIRMRERTAQMQSALQASATAGLRSSTDSQRLATIATLCDAWLESSLEEAKAICSIQAIAGVEDGTEAKSRVGRVLAIRQSIQNAKIHVAMRTAFLSANGATRIGEARRLAELLLAEARQMEGAGAALERLTHCAALNWRTAPFGDVEKSLRDALQAAPDLPHWCSWLRTRAALAKDGGERLGQLIDQGHSGSDLADHVEQMVFICLARRAYELHPVLRTFTGITLSEAQQRVRLIDARLQEFARRRVISTVRQRASRAPTGNAIGPARSLTEMALVLRETAKRRAHVPLRDLLGRAGEALQALMPCFMMSPMSVAQFLRNDGLVFDLVVFDEASQVLPEDAVGAVLRGRQVVVVGDPMQLPPTDFFKKAETGSTDEMDDEDAESIRGLESILDKAQTTFPQRRLRWHFRSRDPSLIAFSNQEFYNNELHVFPAPHSKHPKYGIKLVEIKGSYSGRCNPPEATAMVDAALAFMRRYPKRSLGLVALNSQQRDLIVEKLDHAISLDADAIDYRRNWAGTLEPLFVKNLENVQGDERDVIFISTVFGPAPDGSPPTQRFGPINSDVGHRRLNVLFTRAKESVVLFSSLRPEHITLDPTAKRGRHVLRKYLEYARSGRLETGTAATGRAPESEFEEMVMERLRAAGLQADPQVGVAGYFVDLAVKHPQFPAHYLLGVECDGATYHSFKSARDRDRLRQEILERLGWKIHRIWSTDWFNNPEREIRALLDVVKEQQRIFSDGRDSHLDYAEFANRDGNAATPAVKPRTTFGKRTVAPTGKRSTPEPTANGHAPYIPPDILQTHLRDVEERRSLEWRRVIERSVDFTRGKPVSCQVESRRTGKGRMLELEEGFNQQAFRWAETHRGHPLAGLPWAENLSAEVNLQLRECAIVALIQTGRAAPS